MSKNLRRMVTFGLVVTMGILPMSAHSNIVSAQGQEETKTLIMTREDDIDSFDDLDGMTLDLSDKNIVPDADGKVEVDVNDAVTQGNMARNMIHGEFAFWINNLSDFSGMDGVYSANRPIQNIYITNNEIYVTQVYAKNGNSNNVKISRCEIMPQNRKQAVMRDSMNIEGVGHGQNLIPYQYNNNQYFIVCANANKTKIDENTTYWEAGKIGKIEEIVDLVKKVANQSNLLALNASVEAARAGESGKGFAVVADQVRQLSINTAESAEDIVKYVSELKTNIDELATAMEETTQSLGEGSKKVEKSLAALEQMNGQMDSIRGRVDSIFDDIDTQTGVTKSFAMQMGNISESYSVLSKDCLQSGHRIFEVGRYLDKTRSDLVRGCSEITQQDWMRVFEVDHYVLTWRVYNNIVGFEHLQKKQVDNPAGCKLGKWLNRQTDERLVRSSEYTALVKAHNDLHHFATLSWQAKEDGNTEKALAYFNNTYGAFMEYDKALKHLQQRMKELGYNTDTQIAAFGGR